MILAQDRDYYHFQHNTIFYKSNLGYEYRDLDYHDF